MLLHRRRIPASGLVGEEGQGWMVAMKTLEYERGAKVNPVGGYFVKEMDVMSIVDLARTASAVASRCSTIR